MPGRLWHILGRNYFGDIPLEMTIVNRQVSSQHFDVTQRTKIYVT